MAGPLVAAAAVGQAQVEDLAASRQRQRRRPRLVGERIRASRPRRPCPRSSPIPCPSSSRGSARTWPIAARPARTRTRRNRRRPRPPPPATSRRPAPPPSDPAQPEDRPAYPALPHFMSSDSSTIVTTADEPESGHSRSLCGPCRNGLVRPSSRRSGDGGRVGLRRPSIQVVVTMAWNLNPTIAVSTIERAGSTDHAG